MTEGRQMWFGSSRLLGFGGAEARARRDRAAAADRSDDHRSDEPDDFDASSTPLPLQHPLE
ncbi:hypothetical protein, partial [Rathayibacter iranicus]|uniref:hypothetical protein n=1 Tax=Rathayibacter iranicus TaxID=59737 RepID=UPI001CA5F157